MVAESAVRPPAGRDEARPESPRTSRAPASTKRPARGALLGRLPVAARGPTSAKTLEPSAPAPLFGHAGRTHRRPWGRPSSQVVDNVTAAVRAVASAERDSALMAEAATGAAEVGHPRLIVAARFLLEPRGATATAGRRRKRTASGASGPSADRPKLGSIRSASPTTRRPTPTRGVPCHRRRAAASLPVRSDGDPS
jgi:hypothetical protein